MKTNWEHGKLNMKFYTDQRSCSSGIATYTRAYLGLCLGKRAVNIAQRKQLSLFDCCASAAKRAESGLSTGSGKALRLRLKFVETQQDTTRALPDIYKTCTI